MCLCVSRFQNFKGSVLWTGPIQRAGPMHTVVEFVLE